MLALGEFKGKPNQSRLYTDIRDLMAKYGTADFGEIDIVEILTDLMDVMKENKIVMPDVYKRQSQSRLFIVRSAVT